MSSTVPSTCLSTMTALLVAATLAACGGSPMGLDDRPGAAAAPGPGAVGDHTTAPSAQRLEGAPARVAAEKASTERHPPASVECAWRAEEAIPFDPEAEAQQAPPVVMPVEELVPAPVIEGVNDELR